ncbi:DNA methylase N-4/N-6 domain-containing protein [Halovivax asiaticus JCM 14624]|uniref:Type II methyltransferase n=1 Tax=Halovivax asiaticus JCM 14624 TaxID=1227490 RepID=M0BCT8_9EURY|nr:DNA methyltransferase [Halovivax asiaticus]ELZ08630.1 DNA methylase N-4/N-6 domain-containing protein [Halovivax asiaticus JCM 14624]
MDEGDRHRQSRLFTDEDGSFDESRAREEAFPVEDGEVVDTDELADHQTYLEGRGIYDERNRVNDLTGREWKYATKSVITDRYPPDLQHDLRSEHGGQKPPRLCTDLIERFSSAGDRVLDPFAGVGGTLLGTSLCEHEGTGRRTAVGFEQTERWIDVYETALERENAERRARGEPPLAEQDIRHGDCRTLIEDVDADSIDLLLTDVPYWHMDDLEQTRNADNVRESKLDSFDDGEDGTATQWESKADWLADMGEWFASFTDAVKPDGYVVVFIGDMYRDQSYEFLSADLARSIGEAAPLTLKASLVWYDPTKDLHVYGYPFSFVPSMVHQNVLVFRVESTDT